MLDVCTYQRLFTIWSHYIAHETYTYVCYMRRSRPTSIQPAAGFTHIHSHRAEPNEADDVSEHMYDSTHTHTHMFIQVEPRVC